MKRAATDRFSLTRAAGRLLPALAPFLALAVLLALFGCGNNQLAGGYDDVENPALKLSLLDTNNHPYSACELRIYARYQNPIVDSTPLLKQDVAAGGSASLSDTVVAAAMQAAKKRGAPWPTTDTIEINMLARSADAEAFVDGIYFVKTPNGRYHLRRRQGGSIAFPDAQGILEVTPVMTRPVLEYKGRVGQIGSDLGLKSVFIPGSPYWGNVQQDGSFIIHRLAQYHYEVKAVAQDGQIYSSPDPLFTGAEYAPSDWTVADAVWFGG